MNTPTPIACVDFRGYPISEGCTIIYPVRKGSRMWLKEAKVSQVVKQGDSYRLVVYDPTSSLKRGHSVKNLDTVVVVEVPN